MSYPLSANNDGINIKPELMESEKLYHCVFQNKALLLFKDSNDFLNCYEVEEKSLVNKIKKCKSDTELKKIIDEYLKLE